MSAFLECCRTCLSCECFSKEKRKTFPLLIIFGALATIPVTIVALIIAGAEWQVTCPKVMWNAVLVVYSILFIADFAFIWYSHIKMTSSYKRAQKENTRAIKLFIKDPVVIVFLIVLGVELIFNIVMGVILLQDTCSSESLITMANVCHVFLYIVIVGTISLGIINFIIEGCRKVPAPADQAEQAHESTEPLQQNEDHHDVLPVGQPPPQQQNPFDGGNLPVGHSHTTKEHNPFDNQ
jgi:hypothetical protein